MRTTTSTMCGDIKGQIPCLVRALDCASQYHDIFIRLCNQIMHSRWLAPEGRQLIAYGVSRGSGSSRSQALAGAKDSAWEINC